MNWSDAPFPTYPLSPEEEQALVQQGIEEGKKYKYEIPRASSEVLRDFVFGYCDKRLICDAQVPPHLVGSVFMPLMFGALGVPENTPAWAAQQALIGEDIGKEPQRPAYPPAPEEPSYPPPPALPEGLLTPDPEVLDIIAVDIQYDVSPPERMETYLDEIRFHNRLLEHQHQKAWKGWLYEKEVIRRAYHQAILDHKQAVEDEDNRDQRYQATRREWCLKNARREALRQGFVTGYFSDLGCVYEFYSQALPRGINGYPMFGSCHLLHVEDFKKAQTAIDKELDRRKNLEI